MKGVQLPALLVSAIALAGPIAPPVAAEEITYQLWSRQDPSGPLRSGNVEKAAERLNAALEAEGSDMRVKVEVTQSPAPNFDDDALQLLRVYGIGEGPDMFVQAHEWICAFVAGRLRAQSRGAHRGQRGALRGHLPEPLGIDQVPGRALRHPAGCRGAHVLLQQAAAARCRLSRTTFIESMPDRVLAGEVTMDDLSDIAKQVVDNTDAEYGILHRPSIGPDYLMVFQTYGNTFVDEASGDLLLEPDKLEAAFGWFERNVQNGVIPANNTAMEFDAIRTEFYAENNAAFWMYGIWDLGSRAFPTYGLPQEEEEFFKNWGWIAAPPAEQGGAPSSLTHPIIYAVSADVEHPELAVRLLGFASDADLNTDHAVTTTHIGIKEEQLEDPRYQEAWTLARATEMLEFTKYLPNNPGFGDLNRIIYQAIQGVETGRLTAEDAALFVVDEAEAQLDGVIVK